MWKSFMIFHLASGSGTLIVVFTALSLNVFWVNGSRALLMDFKKVLATGFISGANLSFSSTLSGVPQCRMAWLGMTLIVDAGPYEII